MMALKLATLAALAVLGALGAVDANAASYDMPDVEVRGVESVIWYGVGESDVLTLKLEIANNGDRTVKFSESSDWEMWPVLVFAPTTPDSALPEYRGVDLIRADIAVVIHYERIWWTDGAWSSVCPKEQTVRPGTTSTVILCFRIPVGYVPDFIRVSNPDDSQPLFYQFVDARGARTCTQVWKDHVCASDALFEDYPNRKAGAYMHNRPLDVTLDMKSVSLLEVDGVSGVVLAMEIGVTNWGNEEMSSRLDMRVVVLRNNEAVFYEHYVPDFGDLLRETCPHTRENTDLPPGIEETWRACFRIPDTMEPEFLIMEISDQTHVIPLAAGADCELAFPERLCGEAESVFGVPGAPKVESATPEGQEAPVGDSQTACRGEVYECLDAAVDLVRYERRPLCESCDSDTVSVFAHATYPAHMDHTAGAAFRGAHDLVTFSIKLDPQDRLVMKDLRFVLRFEYGGTERTYFPANDHTDYGIEPSIRDIGLRNEIGIECTGLGDYAVEPLQTVSLCFPIPAEVRELGALGIFNTEPSLYNQYLEVSLGGVCGPNCVGKWEIPAPQVPDGYALEARPEQTISYTYTITNADFYDQKFPSYKDTIELGVAAGLDDWSSINPIGFERVDDPLAADFVITMGGTGENPGLMFNTDTYGRVSDVGCLRDRAYDCSITLFVENEYRGSVDLFTEEMIRFVTAHEIGHTLGFKHHGSATHVMYSPLDNTKSWYDNEKYGLNPPDISRPQYSTMSAERDTHIIELPSRVDVYTNPAFGYAGGSTDILETLEELSLDALRDKWDKLVEGGEQVSEEIAEIVEVLFARAGASP